MRTCRYCGKNETQVRFYDRIGKTARTVGNCCQPCWIRHSVEWRRSNRDRTNARNHRRLNKGRYGLTDKQYDSIFTDSKCAGCGRPDGQHTRNHIKRLTLDHDHTTGQLRGVLCHFCNMAISHTGDSAENLRRLAEYLDRARVQAEQGEGIFLQQSEAS